MGGGAGGNFRRLVGRPHAFAGRKAFAREMLAQKVTYFLPMRKRIMVWGGARRKSSCLCFNPTSSSRAAEDRQTALRNQPAGARSSGSPENSVHRGARSHSHRDSIWSLARSLSFDRHRHPLPSRSRSPPRRRRHCHSQGRIHTSGFANPNAGAGGIAGDWARRYRAHGLDWFPLEVRRNPQFENVNKGVHISCPHSPFTHY